MVEGPNVVVVTPPVIGDNTYILRRFDGTPDVTLAREKRSNRCQLLGPEGVKRFQILGIEPAESGLTRRILLRSSLVFRQLSQGSVILR